jgi:ABC-type amino acid transport substrate-binding protein
MKKYLLLVILFCVASATSFATGSWHGDTWAAARKKGQGNVVFAYTNSPTFSYKDKKGKLTGVCIEIMEGFVKFVEKKYKIKLNAQYKNYPDDDFSSFYGMVRHSTGGVFGLTNATITPERRKEVRFSQPFLNNISIIMTQQGASKLTDIKNIGKDFKNLTAYTNKGTSNERRLLLLKKQYFPAMKIEYFPYNEDVLKKIMSDKKAFTCMDFNYYSDGKQKNMPLKRHPAGDDYSEELGIIMPLGSDWEGVLNEYFQYDGGLVNSREYKKMLTRHLGTEAANILINKK